MVENSRASPLADEKLTDQILKVLEEVEGYKGLKKGANEAVKAINKGNAVFVVLAADTEPLEIVLHIPIICEEKSIPYVFLESKSAIGRVCGISRDIIAVAITSRENDNIFPRVKQLAGEIEKLSN